ncbi:MAG TPA: SLC13 family permease [Candidatus Thermoplasmatota archaeon]|nr:SLC13 family permease [Candidatus Thermoplasmatota archaeon]
MDAAGGVAAAAFVATFVLLGIGRLGRVKLPRGPVALVGGLLTALLLPLSWSVVDLQVLLLLTGLMGLAGLADAAGLFAGLRRRLAGLPPGAALWTAVAVMAIASAALLNDAAVVVLIPLLLPVLLARGLPPVAVVALLAVAANLGSLLTPYGNPQDAVLADAASLGPLDFLAVQGPLVVLGLALLALPCWWLGRRAVPVPAPLVEPLAPRGRPWLVACLLGFAAAASILPGRDVWGHPWGLGVWGPGAVAVLVFALAYAGIRPLVGRPADAAVRRTMDFNVLLLFVGLYLLTGGLGQWFPQAWVPTSSLHGPWPALAVVAALSNAIGNVPAILVLLRLDPSWTLRHAPFLAATSTLAGALLLTGSAASLIAADQARKLGVEVRFLAFLRHALWLVPLVLVAAWWTW